MTQQFSNQQPTGLASLSGTIERVWHDNPDSGFCIIRVKVRGHRELVTVLGSASSVSAGEDIQASGHWEHHRDYGRQFKATDLKVKPPSTVEGIEKYLGSGMIKGVGPGTAKKLITAFGENVFDVIENEPDRLKTLEGIGAKRVAQITSGLVDQKAIRKIMVFLRSHGLGTDRALRIFKTYGPDAIQLVSEDPYRLIGDIKGIGFLTADQIAQRLGVPKTSLKRARAGISHLLAEARSEGNCALPEDDLLSESEQLLEIPREILSQALQLELQEGDLIEDTIGDRRFIFLKRLWTAEQGIAERVGALSTGKPSWEQIDIDKAIPWVETKLGVTLAPSQREAVKNALVSKIMVITGGPGVGKTMLVRSILEILADKEVKVSLCAPTGRAAKRLSDSTGMEAKTIHRLLGANPASGGFQRGVGNPLDCGLLVVDETSMVDVSLMASLLRALPEHAALILVGDADQLPSVGPGQVLADIIDSGAVPVTRLTEIFRQAEESQVVVNAHRINAGQMPLLDNTKDGSSDFYFIEATEPDDAISKVTKIVRKYMPEQFGFDPVTDVQVLCPMNTGSLGTRSMNTKLQAALNPAKDGVSVKRFEYTYKVGDKVMQTANDYSKDVFNGDLGTIRGIDVDAQEVIIEFDDREIVYQFGELDQIALAYAVTIHKSQGSEYPAVVILLTMQHYVMLRRNLLYTGIMRGAKLVILVGDKKAIAKAVKGKVDDHRWSKLRERLSA